MQRGLRAVTLSVGDLEAALRLYEGLLGMRVRASWEEGYGGLFRICGFDAQLRARAAWLESPGASEGAIRLLQFVPAPSASVTDGARPYDHGLVKNLDFFTDDVEGAYARFTSAGHRFLSPPVTYSVGWGGAVQATEAHLPTGDGVKLALAKLTGAPRPAFGAATRESRFTEIAAATQVVADFSRAQAFYVEAFDCVPSAETVVDDPGLVAALHLPPGTRLRLAFIGPPQAVGGKVGLVAYEGDGVKDARSLAALTDPPRRGALALSLAVEDTDHAHARALVAGASEVCAPVDRDLPPFGEVRASSVRSPDGILHELLGPRRSPASFADAVAVADLPPGALCGARTPSTGRVALANVEGQIFALEDRCPHMGGPLSAGRLRGRLITCPWHGWEVDATTGRVRGAPGAAATVRPVRCEGGRVRLGPPPEESA